MKRILLTGMSGTGKTTLIAELAARGYHAVDADCDEYSAWVSVDAQSDAAGTPVEADRDWVWREDQVQKLLDSTKNEVLFVSGCASNMDRFLPQFDHVVLLSAPASTIVTRLATRSTNTYGKSLQEMSRVLDLIETVEPLLRRIADVEIDTSAPLEEVLATLIALTRTDRKPMTHLQSLISNLHSIGCVKFGQFKLKSGLMSPIYIDLRLLVTHPAVLKQAAQAMAAVIESESPAMPEPSKIENPKSKMKFDRLAALPYAGLPIGVAVALETNKPLIYPRKEAKDYGTAKLIEGEYNAGETVLMVDDLITKGTAKLEALKPLTDAGLIVKDILVLIDREQGGAAELAQRGVVLHAVFTLSQMLDELVAAGKLAPAQREEVLAWIKAN